ncbi:unnamed protein product [Rodentolepis nana]|uniref:Uncharacterized protein n=1 Tax=Rodentolepis nana TaxID=102285 RepID=A0A3P7SS77_RODNA|nr:unnamed protein product [Rodentolepis nana]
MLIIAGATERGRQLQPVRFIGSSLLDERREMISGDHFGATDTAHPRMECAIKTP